MNEVNLDGQVVHIKSLDMPDSEKKAKSSRSIDAPPPSAATEVSVNDHDPPNINEGVVENYAEQAVNQSEAVNVDPITSNDGAPSPISEESSKPKGEPPAHDRWPEHFTTSLTPFLSELAIDQVKTMYLEGPIPPRVSDSGWGGRPSKSTEETEKADDASGNARVEKDGKGKRGRDRGGRGGRRGGREDERKVLSDVRILYLPFSNISNVSK